MKKCPHCAEEIQDEAKKCKHCGEWLDGSNQDSFLKSAKGFVNKSSNFVKEQRDKQLTRRYKHLFEPTDSNPFELGDATFLSTGFKYYNEKYSYTDIQSILFHASVDRMNGINTSTETKLELTVLGKTINLSRSSFMGMGSGKKTREKITFIQEYLKKVTFETRAARYLNSVSTKGYFDYPPHFKIHNNGDIEKKNQIVDNICNAYKESRFDYGLGGFSSPLGRVQYSDPFTLTIWKNSGGTKNLLFSKRSAEFNVHSDKDIFDALINKLINEGSIV